MTVATLRFRAGFERRVLAWMVRGTQQAVPERYSLSKMEAVDERNNVVAPALVVGSL